MIYRNKCLRTFCNTYWFMWCRRSSHVVNGKEAETHPRVWRNHAVNVVTGGKIHRIIHRDGLNYRNCVFIRYCVILFVRLNWCVRFHLHIIVTGSISGWWRVDQPCMYRRRNDAESDSREFPSCQEIDSEIEFSKSTSWCSRNRRLTDQLLRALKGNLVILVTIQLKNHKQILRGNLKYDWK